VIRLSRDPCHRTVATDAEVAQLLYTHPDMQVQAINLADPERYNAAIAELYLDWPLLEKTHLSHDDCEGYHAANQQSWLMPAEYQQMDIAKWVLDQCQDQNQLQRAGQELLEYQSRDLMGMLCYLKYLTDVARSNNIVLGVGRGSSVASFVLYLIGVHRIDSLYHNLDFHEFMR